MHKENIISEKFLTINMTKNNAQRKYNFRKINSKQH